MSKTGLAARMGTVAGRTVFALLWLLVFAIGSATIVEFGLRVRSGWHPIATAADSAPRFHALERAYIPCSVQHLHPEYFFFFPLDRAERVAISNDTCRLDADGFRGPGPASAGGRRLAFLLGGSAAFGESASSDGTTIVGYLNRLQNDYFFVNAGVPSWNSTQEMFRLAFQISDYHPALVITYDGANDADLVDTFGRRFPDNAAGMPDRFDDLAALVDQQGSVSARRAASAVAAYLFPELKRTIGARLRRAVRSDAMAPAPLPEQVLQAGVTRYLSNLARMRDLTTTQGGRFVAIFQPVAQLHRHLGPGPQIERFDVIERFHQAVLDRRPRDVEFHDLGNVFDQYFAAIPIMNPDIADDTVFVDQVHLHDAGNEVVARHLATLIR